MNKINQNIRDAVETALVSKHDGCRKFGNAAIAWSSKDVAVSYCGNQVFGFDKRTRKWWIDNCGWVTRMTKDKVEACMEAAGLPYRYFIKNRAQWLRNVETGMTWKCGDGRIDQKAVELAGL